MHPANFPGSRDRTEYNTAGRRFDRTMEVSPVLPQKSKIPSVFPQQLETGIGGGQSSENLRGGENFEFSGVTPFYSDSIENRQFSGQQSKSSRGNFRGEFPPQRSVRFDPPNPVSEASPKPHPSKPHPCNMPHARNGSCAAIFGKLRCRNCTAAFAFLQRGSHFYQTLRCNKRKLCCNIEKAALQESGAFLPLSCGFHAPTFRHRTHV